MTPSLLSETTQQWITEAVGSGAVVRSVQVMPGSTSATLYAVEVEHAGHTLELVLRLFTNAEWLAEEPDLAVHEAAALKKVAGAGIPTPELVAVDETGAICGVPAILMTRVPGAVDLTPVDFDIWLQRLAEPLGVIHAVSADDFGWQFFAYNDVDRLSVPGWSRVPDLWARANELVRGPSPDTPMCFIHRDYHPVNVLWQNGKISGIVDWPNACRGPIGADLGHCRLNLAAMYGVNAADSFLRAYESLTGVGQHPYWDLRMLTDDWQPELEVYTPWAHFGLHHITTRLMGQRLDDYLIRIMARL